jgi:hypothetical protein
MNWYQVALATHTVVAVLGIGSVLSLVLLAQDARAGSNHLPVTLAMMAKLARVVQISLGLMLISGIAVLIPTQFAYAHAWWFRVSFILFLVLGFFTGQLQRAVRTSAVARLSSIGWIMCTLVVIIVILMASKPF